MKHSSLYIVVASALMILFCLVYQGTYAYFVGQATTSDHVTNTEYTTAQLQDLTIIGNNSSKVDWIPGESKDFTFTISNTSTVPMCYDLVFQNVVNEFVNKSDLVYTLKDATGQVIVSDTAFPSVNGTLKSGMKEEANSNTTYTLTITYVDQDYSQFEDMGKTFSASISGNLVGCTP